MHGPNVVHRVEKMRLDFLCFGFWLCLFLFLISSQPTKMKRKHTIQLNFVSVQHHRKRIKTYPPIDTPKNLSKP